MLSFCESLFKVELKMQILNLKKNSSGEVSPLADPEVETAAAEVSLDIVRRAEVSAETSEMTRGRQVDLCLLPNLFPALDQGNYKFLSNQVCLP